ncbi:WecB/TagA/CpsF family glycosyltransferase [Xanthobacter aminoxidans]|uniref:WecB/TagA/CpsF family glycosyltransferase n=1 Tax=Xanthobacter aminoxidans TaxID=186280 RepID=UPI003727CD81
MSNLIHEDAPAERIRIIGVPVDVVNLKSAVARIILWGRSGPPRTVFLRDVHGLMRAYDDPKLLRLHEINSLTVPDGAPVALVGRMRGALSMGRAPGADLMESVCEASVEPGIKHYFFGGKPGVAERMAKVLTDRYPGMQICGIYSPPMRELTADTVFSDEELAEVKAIADCGADLIWVGLSTPKQEFWMMQAAEHVPHGVFLGVGAAFDFHAGDVARAPGWMRDNGLEWLHRLISEPRRLWRRYLLLAPRFVFLAFAEEVSGRLGAKVARS